MRVQTVESVLEKFYGSLSDEQKELQSVAGAPSMIPAGPASRHLHTAAI